MTPHIEQNNELTNSNALVLLRSFVLVKATVNTYLCPFHSYGTVKDLFGLHPFCVEWLAFHQTFEESPHNENHRLKEANIGLKRRAKELK